MNNSLGYYFTLENLFKGPKVVSPIFQVCHGMMVVLLKPKNLKKPLKNSINLKTSISFGRNCGFSTPGVTPGATRK